MQIGPTGTAAEAATEAAPAHDAPRENLSATQVARTSRSQSESASSSKQFDLTQYGITVQDIRRNLSPAALYAEAIREDAKCDIADTGALIAFSGRKDRPLPQGQADRRASRLEGRRLVGRGQRPHRRRDVSRSTASGPSTISTRASGCTSSMPLPAGTERIGRRSA